MADDIAALLADIEAFDLDAAERRARQEPLDKAAPVASGDAAPVFPEILPPGQAAERASQSPSEALPATAEAPSPAGGGLLDTLRRQASHRQRELHAAAIQRNAAGEELDRALQALFSFLHELVQHLNVVKPAISRDYPLLDQVALSGLHWQEGFADYRSQAQSAGALTELVSFSCQLAAPTVLRVDRDGFAVDRFRTLLFDYGLQFSCNEVRNRRHFVEYAEFSIPALVSVTARWRADFAQGRIVLETRNLERLGSIPYHIPPHAMTAELYEEFGRLVLGQPSRFRQLLRA